MEYPGCESSLGDNALRMNILTFDVHPWPIIFRKEAEETSTAEERGDFRQGVFNKKHLPKARGILFLVTCGGQGLASV